MFHLGTPPLHLCLFYTHTVVCIVLSLLFSSLPLPPSLPLSHEVQLSICSSPFFLVPACLSLSTYIGLLHCTFTPHSLSIQQALYLTRYISTTLGSSFLSLGSSVGKLRKRPQLVSVSIFICDSFSLSPLVQASPLFLLPAFSFSGPLTSRAYTPVFKFSLLSILITYSKLITGILNNSSEVLIS